MPINTREIIDLLNELAEEERLRVTVTESLKAAIIAGVSTALGGLLLGPIGLALGGAVGGGAAALTSRDFLPVTKIIAAMEEDRKEMLAQNVRGIIDQLNVTDIAPFAAMMVGDTALRSRVVAELVDYLRTEMSLAVVDR